ncbi:type II secretion system F family protein [Streptomyces sp. NPDC048590]|uniref:type II secretion system F family protein n=1 Tax=Streptomyces sp. NPDC048590 TaxID=3365574 RepID=UPI0037182C9B
MGAVLGSSVCLVTVLADRRRVRAVRRRAALLASPWEKDSPRLKRRKPGPVVWLRLRGWSTVLVIWAGGWVLVGGPAGCAVGLAAGFGVLQLQRSRRGRAVSDQRVDAALVARQLPLAADLLASCLSAGASPREAAEAVGESMPGPVGEQLARSAAEILLGGEPAEAWARFGDIPGASSLARCLERAESTGAPAAEPVSAIADGMRAECASAAVARARRAAVLITAPVGLCFLPAFLAVGVAPVVIGLATGLLQRG